MKLQTPTNQPKQLFWTKPMPRPEVSPTSAKPKTFDAQSVANRHAFLGIFGTGFAVFVLFVSWAFGFGFFAPPSRVAVDRNQKTKWHEFDRSDERRRKTENRMALVANENGNNKDAPVISDASTNPNAATEQDLKLTTGDKTGGLPNNETSANMIVLPDETEASNQTGRKIKFAIRSRSRKAYQYSTELFERGSCSDERYLQRRRITTAARLFRTNPTARLHAPYFSAGFSIKTIQPVKTLRRVRAIFRPPDFNKQNANVPTFGSLLPVRFLGRDLHSARRGRTRANGTFRSVKKVRFSYPAGTIIVGRLRGSEYNRLSSRQSGAIDAKTANSSNSRAKF
jgi:hypothetical protein